jgi:rare lipoprotein A
MRLPVNRSLPLAALTLLAACGGGGASVKDVPPAAVNGPAADYPMVLGAPFAVDGVTYTPVDTMNYDAVGKAGIDAAGGGAISAAHRTLPLPSYAEVTSLTSGKTILVRIERRGPMSGPGLIDLSPGAAAQLGLAGTTDTAVRVRRVNPPEAERALLRSGQPVAPRMDTPKSLLAVLQRKLAVQSGTALPPPEPVTEPTPAPSPLPTAKPSGKPPAVKPPVIKPPVVKPAVTKPAPVVTKSDDKPAAKGSYFVQVGAFSSKANAEAAARKSGGTVSQAGNLWRVRSGPYADPDKAKPALAKARAAGYSDARIQHAN